MGAEETVQSGKRLLCNPHQKAAAAAHTYNPSVEEAEPRGSLGLAD